MPHQAILQLLGILGRLLLPAEPAEKALELLSNICILIDVPRIAVLGFQIKALAKVILCGRDCTREPCETHIGGAVEPGLHACRMCQMLQTGLSCLSACL